MPSLLCPGVARTGLGCCIRAGPSCPFFYAGSFARAALVVACCRKGAIRCIRPQRMFGHGIKQGRLSAFGSAVGPLEIEFLR
jgi:hypothetical protein